MKKRFFLSKIPFSTLFFLLFVLFGCMEEDNFHLNEGKQSISASIIEENLGTRTLLSDNPTNRKMEVYWKSGDAIGVFGSTSGSNIRYQTQESAISKDGKSTVFKTTATAAEGDIIAYYPYQQGATATPDGVLHLTMPATQTYHIEHAGIVQPDATVSIMAGKGKDGSIAFRNLFSILRVNIAGSDGQVVEKVLFTDLSGKPVSGNFTVNWNGELPQAEFPATGSGEDLQIEIDCKDGVALANNSLTKFFLIVPARNYDKGFQVEFILANGEKIIKTIGAAGGKVLKRNMLFPIGDMFPSQDDKVSYTLHEKASIINDERFDYIQSASLNPENHYLTLKVDEGFAPVIGEMILINQTSASLPKGYVGKVKSISGTTVVMEPVTEITEIFEELSIGGPVWSGDGTAIPAGGYAIDLSQFITSIETPDGKPVEFAVDGSSLSMQVPITRAEAEMDTKFSSPKLSHTFRLDDTKNPRNSCGLKVGVQMDLAMYFHILIKRFSLNDLQCRVNPTINASFEFAIEWITPAFGTEIPFIVIRTVPIPAGPVMIIPLIEFYLTFDLEGKIGLTAEISYSEEFSFGMAYENGELNSYGSVVENETNESPLSFNPKVQVEGAFSIGVAPKVGFSIWEIISLDTRVYTKVKTGANVNFDLASTSFNPILYNAISGSKVFSQLELYMKGGVYLWGDRVLATTQSTVLEYPLCEAYFLPVIENLSISTEMNKLEVEMDISNKLFFNSTIGLNFYEKDKETSEFTVKAGSMDLCQYNQPPVGKDEFSLEIEKVASLSPKVYQARVTVSVDAPGGPYTIESGVSTLFSIQDVAITVTTAMAAGETIDIQVDAFLYNGYPWVDLNNNGKKDEGEEITGRGFLSYKVQSQTISVYGDIKEFSCNGSKLTSIEMKNSDVLTALTCSSNQLTSIDVSNCKGLRSLSCGFNQLTSLDVSKCPELWDLSCSGNQLTSLDVSKCPKLNWFSCAKNQLTSLDVSKCKELQLFDCSQNQLTSLNVDPCTELQILNCYENKITSLNVGGFTKLETLNCYKNHLTSLNISGCSKLRWLYCYDNNLTSLNASNLAKLYQLTCHNNELTSLEVSGCAEVIYIMCKNNQLTSLDVSSCTKLEELDCNNNKLTSLNVDGCISLEQLSCYKNGLLGIRPAIFDNIRSVSYDIRYKYKWGYDAKSETYKYIVEKDTEKGYWYAHEPEGGCHSPEPCNPL